MLKNIVTSIITILACQFARVELFGPKVGPYQIVLRQFEECEDTGTRELIFGTKINSKGNNIYTYTNNVCLYYPWDETLKMDIEVQQLSSGLYRPRFITHTFKTCKKFEKVGKEWMKSFFGAAGYNFTGCPLPAGNYSVKDWPVELTLNNIPTLMYMTFKMIVTYYHSNTKIGCLVVFGDVIPKST